MNRFVVFRENEAQGSGFFVDAGADVVIENNTVFDFVDAFSVTPCVLFSLSLYLSLSLCVCVCVCVCVQIWPSKRIHVDGLFHIYLNC